MFSRFGMTDDHLSFGTTKFIDDKGYMLMRNTAVAAVSAQNFN